MGVATLTTSFLLLGHFSQAPVLYQVLLFLHILALSFWTGSLFPLWHLNRTSRVKEAQSAMRRFGSVAVVFVTVLVFCGIVLTSALLDSWQLLVSSSYGRGLLLKVFLVCSLLMVAALNKFLLTPRLNQRGFVEKLSMAIAAEIGLTTVIVVVTATITGVFGIESRM